MTLKILDEGRAAKLEGLCDLIVPGSTSVGPSVYVDASLAMMPAEMQAFALHAIDTLGGTASADELRKHERSPEFAFLRALAIEAYYSDFVAPGKEGPNAWAVIDFQPPRPEDLIRDWSYMGLK